MVEGVSENRINSALLTFQDMTHNPQFKTMPFFLIGTKMDIFTSKIKNSNAFGDHFPDYHGDIHNPQECADFLIQKFIGVAETKPIKAFTINTLEIDQVVEISSIIGQFISETYFD